MCVMSPYTLELWRIWFIWRAVLAGTYHSCAHFRRQGIYLAFVHANSMLNMPNTRRCVLILLYICPQLAGSPPRYHLCAHSRRQPAGAHFFPLSFLPFFFNASIPSRQPAGAHLFSFSTLFISFFPLFFYFFGNAWIPVNTPAGAKYMSSYYYCTFVLILATTICVSAYFYICVTHLDYAASLLVLIDD